MPRVTVEAIGFLRRLFERPLDSGGGDRVAIDVPAGTTVERLVHLLGDLYPAFGGVAAGQAGFTDAVQIVIGDRLLDLAGGPRRVLVDNDHVVLLPPFEGG